jgi:hypothetical protein
MNGFSIRIMLKRKVELSACGFQEAILPQSARSILIMVESGGERPSAAATVMNES